jgi:hypothetical protein
VGIGITLSLAGLRRARARRAGSAPLSGSVPAPADAVVALVYELLDAHADTAALAADLAWSGDERWRAHLDYLQALQRGSRASLARHTEESLT